MIHVMYKRVNHIINCLHSNIPAVSSNPAIPEFMYYVRWVEYIEKQREKKNLRATALGERLIKLVPETVKSVELFHAWDQAY